MSQKVASLFAEIGAETSGFEQGAKNVKGHLNALAPGIEDVRTKLTGFVSANAGLISVLGGTALALKKTYDVAREGAALEYTREKFDRLAQSIGTTSDILLTDMRAATKGTLSDMEAMASVSDFVGLGLAKTGEEAIRLAKVQAGLGMDMNQLVLTLANQTTMRFDQLGVAVDGFDEKVKALEESGMSANEAFKAAFLQQAEEQLKKVGNAADSNIGSFQKFEAQLKNIGDTTKMSLAEGLGPFVDWLAKGMQNESRFSSALQETNKELYNQYNLLHIQTPEMVAAVDELEKREAAHRTFTDALKQMNEAQQESHELIQEEIIDYQSLIGSMMDLQAETDSFNEQQEDTQKQIAELTGELATLRSQGWSENSQKVQEVQGKLNDLNGDLAKNAEAHKKWAAQTVFAFAQARAAADGEITEGEGKILIAVGQQLDLFDQKTADAMTNVNSAFADLDSSNAQDVIAAVEGSLQALTDTPWVIQIATDTSGVIIPGGGGSGGGGSGRAVSLGAMGAQGFVNYGTINVYTNDSNEFMMSLAGEL